MIKSIADTFNWNTELLKVQSQFPNYKGIVVNCYQKVAGQKKDASYILKPAHKQLDTVAKGGKMWKATYNVKWPEPQSFSGIGLSLKEAGR